MSTAQRTYVSAVRWLGLVVLLGILFVAVCSRSASIPSWCPTNTTSACVTTSGDVTR